MAVAAHPGFGGGSTCPACGARLLPSGTCAECGYVEADATADATRRPPLQSLVPGQQFAHRYSIIRLLGAGGMGAVYQAWDDSLGTAVALKLIRSDAGTSSSELPHLEARFKSELKLARQVTHPNVVRIHDLGEVGSTLYLTMEYVQGSDLATVLAREPKPALPRVVSLARQIAAGLAAAHRAGIVHLDLKPANVMVDAQDHAVLMDFGIARSTRGATFHAMPGAVIGTTDYMAPEQARGEVTDARTDVYAFGLILYELLAGRRPRHSVEGGLSSLIQQLQTPPPPLTTVQPDVPTALERVVSKCLQASPAARYPSAEEVLAELEKLDEQGRERATSTRPSFLAWLAVPFGWLSDLVRRLIHLLRRPRVVVDPMPADVPAATSGSPAVIADSALRGQTVYARDVPAAVRADANATIELIPASLDLPEPPIRDVHLVVTRSPDSRLHGQVLPLTEPTFSIGRDPACDACVADPQLSRRHASIERGRSGFIVRDEGSANGTFLNGRLVQASVAESLPFGSTIQVGDTIFTMTRARDAALSNLAGMALGGRYELTRLLRESSRGWIYEAHDGRMDNEVAIKIIDPELMNFPGYREQFVRETSIGSSLHHPHICSVVDRNVEHLRIAGHDYAVNYLCLALMTGGNLRERIDAKRATLDEIGIWVGHIADALDAAHRRGIVHGDIKPSAIVFDEEGGVYLTDFAYAQRLSGRDGGPVFGAPSYVAPEIWEHRALTPQSDQFALAAVAYEAIAGDPPFLGQDNPSIRRRNFAREPVPAHVEASSRRSASVSPQVSALLARALAVAPEDRFETCTSFASALAAALHGKGGSRRSASVFLSYRRTASGGWANYLAKELKERGIVTFVDVQMQDGATQFPAKLAKAIEKSDVFVCLLDPTTLDSAWVLEEIRHAYRSNKPMVPVFQQGFDPNTVRPGLDAAVDALLTYDAVHLLDRLNAYPETAAEMLADRIQNAVSLGSEGCA